MLGFLGIHPRLCRKAAYIVFIVHSNLLLKETIKNDIPSFRYNAIQVIFIGTSNLDVAEVTYLEFLPLVFD